MRCEQTVNGRPEGASHSAGFALELAERIEDEWELEMVVYETEDLPPLQDVVRRILALSNYSNPGADLVGAIADQISGKPGEAPTLALVKEILRCADEITEAE